MNSNLLHGELVRLAVMDPQEIAEAFCRWDHDSEYHRLLDSEPSNQHSIKKILEWIQKDQEKTAQDNYPFAIRTLDGDRLVGFIGLGGTLFHSGEAFVGIGIGERELWGKGYGTDAMRVILRYAFEELNLRRVTLDTFEYNPRAVHSYEKAGFVHEGRERSWLYREGRRWDMIYMGILREEWLAGTE